jgi:hypothetical protein
MAIFDSHRRVVVRALKRGEPGASPEAIDLGRGLFGGWPPQVGKVVDVGSDGVLGLGKPAPIAIGDTVMFDMSTGRRTVRNGRQVVVLNPRDVVRVPVEASPPSAGCTDDEIDRLRAAMDRSIEQLRRLSA